MLKNRIFWTIVMAALMLTLVSCLKKDDATVLLPLPIGVIYGVDVPDGMLDHISVYEGTDPPNVEGRYLASPMTLQFASDQYWNDDFFDLYLAFTEVKGRLRTSYKETQSNTSGDAPEARIIGRGDHFTVYFTTTLNDNTLHWSCTTLTIISGKLTTEGIDDFQYANAMLSKTDPDHLLMDVGQYHVFTTQGRPAVPYQWQ